VIDWTINLGSILTFGGIVFAAGGFFYSTKTQNERMSNIEQDLKSLNKVVMDVALSNQRQDNFEKRTDDRFRHVEDDIRELKAKGVVPS
jgi:hypothetical protein